MKPHANDYFATTSWICRAVGDGVGTAVGDGVVLAVGGGVVLVQAVVSVLLAAMVPVLTLAYYDGAAVGGNVGAADCEELA